MRVRVDCVASACHAAAVWALLIPAFVMSAYSLAREGDGPPVRFAPSDLEGVWDVHAHFQYSDRVVDTSAFDTFTYTMRNVTAIETPWGTSLGGTYVASAYAFTLVQERIEEGHPEDHNVATTTVGKTGGSDDGVFSLAPSTCLNCNAQIRKVSPTKGRPFSASRNLKGPRHLSLASVL